MRAPPHKKEPMHSPTAPFIPLGWAAIVAAGVIAAAIAHQPTEAMVWMVAYLVLIAGAAQVAIGRGLHALPDAPPPASASWGQWVLLNLGHAGIIAGTLSAEFPTVAGATVVYWIAGVWLALSVRPAARKPGLVWFRGLITVLLISSLIGLSLSWMRTTS